MSARSANTTEYEDCSNGFSPVIRSLRNDADPMSFHSIVTLRSQFDSWTFFTPMTRAVSHMRPSNTFCVTSITIAWQSR